MNPDSTRSSLVFHCLTDDDDGAIYFPWSMTDGRVSVPLHTKSDCARRLLRQWLESFSCTHYLVSYFWCAPTITLLSFFCFFISSASLCMVIIMLSLPVFWKSSWCRKKNAAQIAIKIKALLLEWKEEKPIGCADIYKVKKLWDIARLFDDNHTRQLFCRNIQDCVAVFLSKLQSF